MTDEQKVLEAMASIADQFAGGKQTLLKNMRNNRIVEGILLLLPGLTPPWWLSLELRIQKIACFSCAHFRFLNALQRDRE